MSEVSRRGFLAGLAATGVAASSAGFVASKLTGTDEISDSNFSLYGIHQVGIATPIQDSLYFISFDLLKIGRDDLIKLLKDWTSLAAQLMAGEIEAKAQSYDAPPTDTGETVGAEASNLTITFGFGPTLFMDKAGKDRFDIGNKRPIELENLPKLPKDAILESDSHGDLCIQICGNSPSVVFHAGRNLAIAAFGKARIRWAQQGFSGSIPSKEDLTPRNLFGFKDGTANPMTTTDLQRHIWIDNPKEPAFIQGGTYLALRKIKMNIETWDRTSLREQEAIFGRSKPEGSPLSGGTEFGTPNFETKNSKGELLIPNNSHIAIAHSTRFGGRKMLRRGYNFENGLDKVGHLDAGLLFIAFQNSLKETFSPVLSALSKNDALNEYLSHIGTAVFAIPHAPNDSNDFIGSDIFI